MKLGMTRRRLGQGWPLVDKRVAMWLFVFTLGIGDPLSCLVFCCVHARHEAQTPHAEHDHRRAHSTVDAHHASPVPHAHGDDRLVARAGCHVPMLSRAETTLQSDPFMPVFGRLAALLIPLLLPLLIGLRLAHIVAMPVWLPPGALAPPVRPPILVTL